MCALSILAGCPGNLDNPERFDTAGGSSDPTAVPACMTTLFNGTSGKCSGNLCHTAGPSPGGDLDLSSAGVGKRLIDVPATHAGIDMDGGNVNCPSAKLVDTSNPAASWLLIKINGTQGTCGSSMPQVGTLTTAEKACITTWVDGLQSDSGTSTGGAGSGGTGGTSTGGASGSTSIAGSSSSSGGSGGAAATGGSGGAAATGTGGAAAGASSGGGSGGASSSAGTGGA